MKGDAPTRTDDLLVAFHRAGKRGLTTREMKVAAGSHAVRLLGLLIDAGYGFCSEPSRYRSPDGKPGRPWRYWLTYEPPVPTIAADAPGPATSPVEAEQPALFEASAPPPATYRAVEHDVAAPIR